METMSGTAAWAFGRGQGGGVGGADMGGRVPN